MTLKKAKVTSGCLVVLEEGPPQFEGMGLYSLLLWSPTPHTQPDVGYPCTPYPRVDPSHALNTPNAAANTLTNTPSTPNTASNSTPNSTSTPSNTSNTSTHEAPLDALDVHQATQRRHLIPLGCIECHEEAALVDLQYQVRVCVCLFMCIYLYVCICVLIRIYVCICMYVARVYVCRYIPINSFPLTNTK